jgi:hypothetical protein
MDQDDVEIRPSSETMPADWARRYLSLLGAEQECRG